MKAAEHINPIEAELQLGKRHTTDYGKRYEGVVRTEDDSIPITWREPTKRKQSGRAYVMGTGWLGEKASMRRPAHLVVRAGHIAVTFNHNNRGISQVLKQNAGNMAAVIDSMPPGLKLHAVALSMSGGGLPDALNQTKRRVESATAVAAANIPGPHSLLEAATHLGATVPEVLKLARHPRDALYLSLSTWRNCASRLLAVGAEFEAMRHGTEPDGLHAVQARPDAPFLSYMYGDDDHLFPRATQEEAAQRLQFNHVEMYHGGHLALLHSVELSQRILEIDDQVLAGAIVMPPPTPANEFSLAA
jgi:pimeloyl-ACP methyl ester carboxylesterase